MKETIFQMEPIKGIFLKSFSDKLFSQDSVYPGGKKNKAEKGLNFSKSEDNAQRKLY